MAWRLFIGVLLLVVAGWLVYAQYQKLYCAGPGRGTCACGTIGCNSGYGVEK